MLQLVCNVKGTADWEIWVWSVSADAWRTALAGYYSASAVQACCDSPSLSSPSSSMLPRRPLCASLRSSWSPASAICQCHQLSVLRVRLLTYLLTYSSIFVPQHWVKWALKSYLKITGTSLSRDLNDVLASRPSNIEKMLLPVNIPTDCKCFDKLPHIIGHFMHHLWPLSTFPWFRHPC